MKEKISTVTKKDCDWEFFRSTGAGGQHRDKTSNACRVRHNPSGAVGTCQDYREQSRNRREAFIRMVESKEFRLWAHGLGYEKVRTLAITERESCIRVRTYDFGANRVIDHQSNRISTQIKRIMDGELELIR
jgi:protein subunit release factor A